MPLPSPRLYVVRDTNVYRSVGYNDFKLLTSAESGLGIIALANYFVAGELLHHLDDLQGENRGRCFRAAQRLAADCADTTTAPPTVRFVADAEAQVAHTLFGVELERRDQEHSLMGGTLGEISKVDDPDDLDDLSKRFIRATSQHVVDTERRFREDMFERVVRTVNPDAKDWRDACSPGAVRDEILSRARRGESLSYIAEAYVIKAARDAGVSVFPHELTRKGKLLLKWFPAPVYAYDELVNRTISSGVDFGLSRNVNSIWDLQVAFSTGTDATVNGVPLWLVTDDSLLLRARERGNAQANILSPTEYGALVADKRAFLSRLATS